MSVVPPWDQALMWCTWVRAAGCPQPGQAQVLSRSMDAIFWAGLAKRSTRTSCSTLPLVTSCAAIQVCLVERRPSTSRGPSSCPVLVLKRVCGASWSSSLMVHEITSGVSSWVSLAALV